LIILYGSVGEAFNEKQQRQIDGLMTCGFRPYAEKAGAIVYLSPQKVRHDWELSIPNPKDVIRYCKQHPESVVFSIKWDPAKQQAILPHIPNRKLYYSCGSKDLYCPQADVSLVDTPDRIVNQFCRVFHKGKDPEFWFPINTEKCFDYILMGRWAIGKNQDLFLSYLDKQMPQQRRILWIGGEQWKQQVFSDKHLVVYTPQLPPEKVREHICMGRVGIVFTEYSKEGFPETFTEMTMCGVPVVYSDTGPFNPRYFSKFTCKIASRTTLVQDAESLLANPQGDECRREAMRLYNLDDAIDLLLEM
jgi:glycosyltransferase involved in cell wall biosynthesis